MDSSHVIRNEGQKFVVSFMNSSICVVLQGCGRGFSDFPCCIKTRHNKNDVARLLPGQKLTQIGQSEWIISSRTGFNSRFTSLMKSFSAKCWQINSLFSRFKFVMKFGCSLISFGEFLANPLRVQSQCAGCAMLKCAMLRMIKIVKSLTDVIIILLRSGRPCGLSSDQV